MKFYSFWRSLASFRVRIALNIKGLVPDEVVNVDLMKGEQLKDDYKQVNPQMLLPALIDGDGPILFQSIAIMEYLDETHPNPPILPKDPRGRARVRALALINAADSHPLMVPRVRDFMQHELKLDEPAREKWIRHWIGQGLAAMEGHLSRDKETGKYRARRCCDDGGHLRRRAGDRRGLLQGRRRALPDRDAHRDGLHGTAGVRQGASAEAARRASERGALMQGSVSHLPPPLRGRVGEGGRVSGYAGASIRTLTPNPSPQGGGESERAVAC